ncbi:PIG-L deacetylase family protein [Novosphingobium aerophilum]|uniref:PIG-L deacetylase family protein n=1 Tax=Novosphingobium TaxID=165696 RepID=UPI0006C839F5|nr:MULTISPECIES: PIG-L deacetylase family protein [unclassified Novosphingobium]KPH65957.1 GlcNAc-PI de-N-acetylase [Novosphingobium sp. ST904]MPS70954.1 PIG-L family deacetylase [Novosphingobium sp.]TCM38486.1 LmbE family N-acetylglucosaminyl deacetylase [Novosphingobium sp. ST904]WRT92503.1 PIG-L deacetylase family protein [Novosphingobium sp. RL4]
MALQHYGKVLVIAPHPDDEILGCGGTMARMVEEGLDVQVAVITSGRPPAFAADGVARVQAEMRSAHAHIGVSRTHMLDFPAASLDIVPAAELNAAFCRIVRDVQPDTLFVPFLGDIHQDHQLAFLASMVAARPRDRQVPTRVLCYETLSETNWYAAPMTPPFVPNVHIDISGTLQRKLDAFAMFESQVRPFPDERSLITIEALARLRGSTVYCEAAEGFILVRAIER